MKLLPNISLPSVGNKGRREAERTLWVSMMTAYSRITSMAEASNDTLHHLIVIQEEAFVASWEVPLPIWKGTMNVFVFVLAMLSWPALFMIPAIVIFSQMSSLPMIAELSVIVFAGAVGAYLDRSKIKRLIHWSKQTIYAAKNGVSEDFLCDLRAKASHIWGIGSKGVYLSEEKYDGNVVHVNYADIDDVEFSDVSPRRITLFNSSGREIATMTSFRSLEFSTELAIQDLKTRIAAVKRLAS